MLEVVFDKSWKLNISQLQKFRQCSKKDIFKAFLSFLLWFYMNPKSTCSSAAAALLTWPTWWSYKTRGLWTPGLWGWVSCPAFACRTAAWSRCRWTFRGTEPAGRRLQQWGKLPGVRRSVKTQRCSVKVRIPQVWVHRVWIRRVMSLLFSEACDHTWMTLTSWWCFFGV